MSPHLKRRAFLKRALTLLLVPVAACSDREGGGHLDNAGLRDAGDAGGEDAGMTGRDATLPAEPCAVAYFAQEDLRAARDLGTRYMTSMKAPINEQSVLTVASNTVGLIQEASSDEAALSALVAAVRTDFVTARTVDLGGWVLSQTELELCALCLISSD